jgi:hypothetical protein
MFGTGKPILQTLRLLAFFALYVGVVAVTFNSRATSGYDGHRSVSCVHKGNAHELSCGFARAGMQPHDENFMELLQPRVLTVTYDGQSEANGIYDYLSHSRFGEDGGTKILGNEYGYHLSGNPS